MTDVRPGISKLQIARMPNTLEEADAKIKRQEEKHVYRNINEGISSHFSPYETREKAEKARDPNRFSKVRCNKLFRILERHSSEISDN